MVNKGNKERNVVPSVLTQKKPSKGFLVVRLPRGPTGDVMAVESQDSGRENRLVGCSHCGVLTAPHICLCLFEIPYYITACHCRPQVVLCQSSADSYLYLPWPSRLFTPVVER